MEIKRLGDFFVIALIYLLNGLDKLNALEKGRPGRAIIAALAIKNKIHGRNFIADASSEEGLTIDIISDEEIDPDTIDRLSRLTGMPLNFQLSEGKLALSSRYTLHASRSERDGVVSAINKFARNKAEINHILANMLARNGPSYPSPFSNSTTPEDFQELKRRLAKFELPERKTGSRSL